MRYKLLGKSGLRVSELCLGTMTFGDERGWGSRKKESRDIYGAFIESGGRNISGSPAISFRLMFPPKVFLTFTN